eukprot:15303200-Alexandrium_andersonii.AAC.1
MHNIGSEEGGAVSREPHANSSEAQLRARWNALDHCLTFPSRSRLSISMNLLRKRSRSLLCIATLLQLCRGSLGPMPG